MEIERGYNEIKMMNNDVYKVREPPAEWIHDGLVIGGRTVFDAVTVVDMRTGLPVIINTDLICSIRWVEDLSMDQKTIEEDREVAARAARASVDALGPVLNAVFGTRKELPPEEIPKEEE